MTRLNWGAVGERFFEVGVDRGVLYVSGTAGVAWNGLTSVNEEPSNVEVRTSYLDGVKYANRVVGEEFQATLEAYTYPDEFAECDGTKSVSNGLYATQQKRKSFGLCYRTRIGNDLEGVEHGYKIHIVYGAVAQPSSRSNGTMSSSVDPFNFSWQITTKPPVLDGRKPSSHFVIDSRDTPSSVLEAIEDVLYGTETDAPRLPTVHELVFIFESYNVSFFDAGLPTEPYYTTFDGGIVPELQTSTIEGGTP